MQLCEGIDWIGFVDWNVRDFHSYKTDRGSTYNAYLVQDEKTALIDTVKRPFAQNLLQNIQSRTDLSKIDYIVCNHAEPDHSGALPEVMKACPNAVLVCNDKCLKYLGMYYDTEGWNVQIVKDGETLSLGKRTLTFVNTPMVHWPESMMTYVKEEKLLFSMDVFGQHYASGGRFDDQESLDVIMAEAKAYFANIVMLYRAPGQKALDTASKIDIDIIAPSHGVIWRTHVDKIVSAYQDWVKGRRKAKVLIIYDTMWHSTEKMASAVLEGAMIPGVDVKLFFVRNNDLTNLATEVLDSAAIAFGSATLNQTLMPQLAALLAYLKGFKPSGKAGFSFGSYGWSKGACRDIEGYLKDMKFALSRDPIEVQFAPTKEILDECRDAGRELSEKALQLAGEDQQG